MSLDNLEFLDIPNADGSELQSLLAERGWGDGLPLIAPTPERVETMLSILGDEDPDEIIAILPPRSGTATRKIIAINAVSYTHLTLPTKRIV